MIRDGIYRGQLWHRRQLTVEHRFGFEHAMFYCDLALISEVCQRSKWVSEGAFNAISFYRSDYLPSERPLRDTVIELIFQQTGKRFAGRICLLANWRSFGIVMNPITLFYCSEENDLQFVVVEVHNTPWNERHVYVLDCQSPLAADKAFHVSPFMPMEMVYHFELPQPDQECKVVIQSLKDEAVVFSAGLQLCSEPMTADNLRRFALSYPLMAARVVGKIYWQALVLWLKRVPFYSHPQKSTKASL